MDPTPDFRSPPASVAAGCPLCTQTGGALAWRGHGLRVVVPDEPEQPGVARVILDEHVAELSDLDDARRERLMTVVAAVERVLREALAPDKINLAALGNMVPHLHWHVIPRWRDDARFPGSPWSVPADEPSRIGPAEARRAAARAAADGLRDRLARELTARLGGDAAGGRAAPDRPASRHAGAGDPPR